MTFEMYVRPRARMFSVLSLLMAVLISPAGYGQESPVEWIGGTDSDWNTNSNWLNGTPPIEDIFGPLNNVALSKTIDLGGTKTIELFTLGPAGGGGAGVGNSGKFAALVFDNVGAEQDVAYTIQNGTINLDSAGTSGAVLDAGDDLTINLNASVSGGSFYQVGGGSTLNIGPGITGGDRFAFYNSGETGSTATANVNAENYAFQNDFFGLWTVGAGNPSSVAIPTIARNTVVNVNVDQSIAGVRTDIGVGWAEPESSSKLIIRNGATVTTNGVVLVGMSGTFEVSDDPEIASSYVQIGDETSTGFLNLTSTSNSIRLGTTIHPNHTSGTEGVLDIVNGEVVHNQTTPLLLGYGREFQQSYVLPGSTGRIVFRENGTFRTRANITERDVESDNFGPGRGILEFDGGTFVVDDGMGATQASTLIDAGVEVNVMDGGMVFQISEAVEAISGGDFNGDGTINLADYTVWRDNLGGDEAELAEGTGDGSTVVDSGDYDLWKTNFGLTVSAGVVGSATITAPLLGVGTGGLTVQGGGELILVGANTYTGDTVIDDSILSLAIASLADVADVAMIGDAVLDLAFGGTDTIDQLLFDGAAQSSGTWGAIGSGADNEDARFTGSGLLMVSTGLGALTGLSTVPEPSTAAGAIMILIATAGFASRRRR